MTLKTANNEYFFFKEIVNVIVVVLVKMINFDLMYFKVLARHRFLLPSCRLIKKKKKSPRKLKSTPF